MRSLSEKISLETSLSQELVCMFTPERITEIVEILIPYADKGADFKLEVHIDIGEKV